MNENIIAREILNILINKYERSVSFNNLNKKKQNFTLNLRNHFPKYLDNTEFLYHEEVNDNIIVLINKGFVKVTKDKSEIYFRVILNEQKIGAIYTFLQRAPKRDKIENIEQCLEDFKSLNPVLNNFCITQLKNIDDNKQVLFYNDINDFRTLLRCVQLVYENEEYVLERQFSVRFFSDSKLLSKYKSRVNYIFENYSEEKFNDVFIEHNIHKNPAMVFIKGEGSIIISGQFIDLSCFKDGFCLVISDLEKISSISIKSKYFVTIENLTTFYTYNINNKFVMYTGGFINNSKLSFIRKIISNNPLISLIHFGDIDVGGFKIYYHLKKELNIPIDRENMNVQTLTEYSEFCKPLTKNDVSQLIILKNQYPNDSEIFNYMIENNCKLEQEIIDQN